MRSQKILVLSITSLSVGFFDFAHALSFSGMPDFFTPSSPTKAIYFWFAGRLTDCLGFLFLASPWFNFINFRRWRWTSLWIVLLWTLAGYILILGFPEVLPLMFAPGVGLSDLKIMFEWVLIVGFLIAAVLFYYQAKNPNPKTHDKLSSELMGAASLLFAMTGVFFTFYRTVDDLFNLAGHLYKAVGLILVYRAVFIECIRLPFNEMKKSAAQAQSANAAKSRFLANVSHEFRTPLGIINGFSELLLEKDLDSESKEWSQTIHRSSTQLRYLVDDLLDLTKAENEKISITKKSFASKAFLADLKNELRLLAERKNIGFRMVVPTNTPELFFTDPVRLRQILVNIIGNAIKFTAKGEVSVRLEVVSDETVVVRIQDTGVGIDQQNQELLFKPFSQVDDSFTRQFGGTGLGLALSKKLAQLLGGDLTLEKSEKDIGSTFHFWFPNTPPQQPSQHRPKRQF